MKRKIGVVVLIGCLVSIMLTGCLDYGTWYIHATDNNGEGVEGVQLQLCDDSTCIMLTTDDIGHAEFEGKSEKYEVHVISVPDGYEYNGGDLIAEQFEELNIVLNKIEKRNSSNIVTSDSKQDAKPTDESDEYEEKTGSEESGAENTEASNLNDTALKVKTSDKKITFSSIDVNGNAVDDSIFSNYKMTMINIWEPWCGPCQSEMPDLEALYQEYIDKGMLIIGVYSDSNGLQGVLNETGVTYPIIRSTSCFSNIVNQTQVYPTTLFVDSEGYVLMPTDDEMPYLYPEEQNGYFSGARDYSSWKSMIDDRL